MFYFKKYDLSPYQYDQIESGLRKASLKRTSPFTIFIESYNLGTDKSFFGYEGKKALTFTRIKTSFEKILPRLIVKLQPGNTYYEVKLGVESFLFFLLFSIGWLLSLINILIGKVTAEGFLTLIIFTGIYVSLLFLEFKLTTSRVNKAVSQALPE